MARKRPRAFEATHRVADREAGAIAAALKGELGIIRGAISLERLEARLSSRASLATILAEVAFIRLRANLERASNALGPQFWLRLQAAISKAVQRSGRVNATLLGDALNSEVDFNGAAPDVALFARRRSVELAGDISEDVRHAVVAVLDSGSKYGVTVAEQARLIRDAVGLPPNWALAPLNLRDEILAGDLSALDRRLSATDAAQIRSRINAGTADEAFAAKMVQRYSASLTNLRAQTVARTESIAAATHGQQESWRQAREAGDIPEDARQFWIVTLLEGLCPICEAIPGMNPDGQPLGQPFETPEGPVYGPPDPHPNCRCGLGLAMPRGGVL